MTASIQDWSDDVHCCQVQCGAEIVYANRPEGLRWADDLSELLEERFGPGDLTAPSGQVEMLDWVLA